MDKIKTFSKTKTFTDENGGRHILLIYGELREVETLRGVVVTPVEYTRGSHIVVNPVGDEDAVYVKTDPTWGTRKEFNFGWSVCSAGDKYDEATGIKIAKTRFAKSPLSTQTGTMLTDDMINAILENEIEFIYKNKLNDAFKRPVSEPTPKKKSVGSVEKVEETPLLVKVTWKNSNLVTYGKLNKRENGYSVFDWKITFYRRGYSYASPWCADNDDIKEVTPATREEIEEFTEKMNSIYGKNKWNFDRGAFNPFL